MVKEDFEGKEGMEFNKLEGLSTFFHAMMFTPSFCFVPQVPLVFRFPLHRLRAD